MEGNGQQTFSDISLENLSCYKYTIVQQHISTFILKVNFCLIRNKGRFRHSTVMLLKVSKFSHIHLEGPVGSFIRNDIGNFALH